MHSFWYYFTAFMCILTVHNSYATNVIPSHPKIELHCEQIGKPGRIRLVLLKQASPSVIRCELYKNNAMLNLQATLFHGKKTRPAKLTYVTFNSTWSKKYSVISRLHQTEWTFSISERDFFHHVTDFEIPVTQTPTYVHTSLKWYMRVSMCHPRVNPCAVVTMVIVHQATDHLFRKTWGEWVPGIPLNEYTSLISSTSSYIHTTHVPCQSGSSFMFLSNTSVTYIAVSWNSFLPNSTLFYKLTCDEADVSPCSSVQVYHAIITTYNVMLVTEHGILVSNALDKECSSPACNNINFHRVGNALDTYNPVWADGKLSYTPACIRLTSIVPLDGVVLFTFKSGNGKNVIAYSSEPFKNWKIYSTNQEKVMAVYDQQTRSVISIHQLNNNSSVSQSRMLSSKKQRFSSFSFPTTGQVTCMLMMPNHYLYAAISNMLWLSTDGGNMYSKIHEFSSSEQVIKLVGHGDENSILLLTSTGAIWWGKAGFLGLKHLLTVQNPLKGMDLVFDGTGYPVLLNSEPGVNPLHTRLVDVFIKSEVCRYSISSNLQESLYYLDLSTSFSFSVSATVKNDNSMVPTGNSMISITMGNPQIFKFELNEYRASKFVHLVQVVLTAHYNIKGVSSISFNLKNVRSPCSVTSYTLLIVADCPISKQLHFEYSSLLITAKETVPVQDYVSSNVSTYELLQELPHNYRPPSSMAVAIPISGNVYNVDPQTISNERFMTYSYSAKRRLKGFCNNKLNRTSCSCTSAHKFSSLEEYTDCREKVYKVLYDYTYKLNFSMLHNKMHYTHNEDSEDISKYLIYIEEVNGRDDTVYFASDNADTFCSTNPNKVLCRSRVDEHTPPDSESAKLLNFLTSGKTRRVFNASQLSIKFLGMGLFHFRVTLATGYSFCSLQDEFQAYVINPPLPFPTGTIIRLTVSFSMGAVMVAIYMRLIFKKYNKEDKNVESNVGSVNNHHRRPRMSVVTEDDMKALRSKLRSSFQA
ncbi:uncharacterized protein LOC100175059 [Ciona intestinalis]